MTIDYAARVEIGRKETNDDRVFIGNRILDMTSAWGEASLPALVAVCDGCGGYDGGGIAAQTVLEQLAQEKPEALGNPNYLARVLEQCIAAVRAKKAEMPSFGKMCTTLAGCVFLKDAITIFHSGDSRVYRYDGWGLAKMTVDHSVVQQMVDMGQITEEEALRNPNRNIITRCIGANCLPPEIYAVHTPIAPGEKYVLCSDGLWECIPGEIMKRVLSGNQPLKEMADELVETALELGSDDNISICIFAARGNKAVMESKPFVLD